MTGDALGMLLRGDYRQITVVTHPPKIVIQRTPNAIKPNVPWAAKCWPCTDAHPFPHIMRAATHDVAVRLAVRHARVIHGVIL